MSVGYHLPVSDNVDFFTELGYLRTALGIDISGYGDVSDSGNGYRVAGGFARCWASGLKAAST